MPFFGLLWVYSIRTRLPWTRIYSAIFLDRSGVSFEIKYQHERANPAQSIFRDWAWNVSWT